MSGYHFLFVPGPSNVPAAVQQAIHCPMEDHRNPNIPDLIQPILEDLKKVLLTKSGKTVFFPSSGTGCWEAALQSTLNMGDKVLGASFGQFSMLWLDMCARLKFTPVIMEEEWGTGANLDNYHKYLSEDKEHSIKAVLVCQNETATGVKSDVAGVRKILDDLGHPALLMVDGVSSVASYEFRMDDWGVDCVVSGSQKGFMMPAGLGILGVSEKAFEAMKNSTYPTCYFDVADMIEKTSGGFLPYTPPINLLRGFRVALDLIFEEGLENIWKRHHRLAEGTRRAIIDGWGLNLCAKEEKWYSDTVSAIVVPDGADAVPVISTAFHKYNLALGAGLAKVAGKVFRIGHLGDLNELMLCGAISGAEMAMMDNGIKVELGSGVAAASKYWLENPSGA
ncbi:MAG: aminotransferase class V-fold PLP-dependent enzyme [Pseudomonadota bacterium]|nr:aminotransferase class V-fold PLP-dependent enzyme [Pseudomonadota bacterium]MEC8996614.1 aminotransferase class V-fold PLP-dependent enzyme [Pseudomonadota bacterium]MED5274734.1 aminotransferase class V-fold PLP-dependent enzyme [Pseudomonadota bacterium]|tara:strand:- start:28802 stop:29980 length:1179 start_codon:yes stop_codon:yes gene_type:complete